MVNLISRVSGVLLLFTFFVCTAKIANAQIAPTNSATISGSVSDSAGKPVAGTKVSLSGPKIASTQTDAQGLFVFIGVSFGTYQVSAAAAGFGTATRSISVTGDTNVAIQYAPSSANGFKVIAQVSSVANAVFNVTSASISQTNPRASAFEGKTTWRTILEQIPGVAQAGYYNGEDQTHGIPDSPLTPMQISIDGALPYETATLLDGMPLIGTGANSGIGITGGQGTDLSYYPLNAFDSADVVRGPGANAPSIVDSIGGSLVLHTGGIVTANHYDFSLSTDPYGGIVANALAAMRWKKLSVIVAFGVNDSPGPVNSAEILYSPDIPYPVTVDGHSFAPYNPSCSPPNCLNQYGTHYLINPGYYNPLNPNANALPYYGYQTSLLQSGENFSTAWSQRSGMVGLTYQLSPSTTAEVIYSGQSSNNPYAAARFTLDFSPLAGYTGSLPAGQYGYQGFGFGFDGGRNSSSLVEEKLITRIGAGVLRLSALQNRTFEYSLISGEPSSKVVRLYGTGYLDGSLTPTYFNGQAYSVTYCPFDGAGGGTNETNNRDILMSYATPLGENFHAGASIVKSYYDGPFEENFSFFGFPLNYSIPSAISQSTSELRFFVGGNLSQKTSLDLSTYFVNVDYHIPNPADPNSTAFSVPGTNFTYTDVRNTYAAPRLGFVWRPSTSVAVRAALGGGFAETPLGSYVSFNSSIPSINNSSAPAFYTVSPPNLGIQPEKSFGFTLGTDIRLHHNTVLSFDVYRTTLFGQFYNSSNYSGLCNAVYGSGSSYCAYGNLPLYTTQNGNLGQSRYEGVLLDVHHDIVHGVYWSVSGGFTRGYVVSVPAGFYNTATCTMCVNLSVVPNSNFNGAFTGVSVPYAQGLGTIGYRWSAGKYLDLSSTYYGSNNTYFHPAFVIFNGDVSYPLSKNVSLLLTARNITGVYDRAVQFFTFSNFAGAPTVAGPPFPEWSEPYGPRTAILTMQMHL